MGIAHIYNMYINTLKLMLFSCAFSLYNDNDDLHRYTNLSRLSSFNWLAWATTSLNISINSIWNIWTLSPLRCSRSWSVVFHCLASHAPNACGSWTMPLTSGNEQWLTTDQACWYLNERSCYEEYEYMYLILILLSTCIKDLWWKC